MKRTFNKIICVPISSFLFLPFHSTLFLMASSLSPLCLSIVDYKRPFNIDVSSIKEYFCSVLASDGSLDRGALRNGNLLFKSHFVHSIAISRRYIEITITAKCRAQMKKAVTYLVSHFISSFKPKGLITICMEFRALYARGVQLTLTLMSVSVSSLTQVCNKSEL